MSNMHSDLLQVTYKCNDKQQHINTSIIPRFVNQQRDAYSVSVNYYRQRLYTHLELD